VDEAESYEVQDWCTATGARVGLHRICSKRGNRRRAGLLIPAHCLPFDSLCLLSCLYLQAAQPRKLLFFLLTARTCSAPSTATGGAHLASHGVGGVPTCNVAAHIPFGCHRWGQPGPPRRRRGSRLRNGRDAGATKRRLCRAHPAYDSELTWRVRSAVTLSAQLCGGCSCTAAAWCRAQAGFSRHAGQGFRPRTRRPAQWPGCTRGEHRPAAYTTPSC
jgi:hypothetical protein